ncbi:MAG TPA: c-type cytochrome [Acidimicrobiia bacterium]
MMPERPPDPAVERSTRRWIITGVVLTALFALAFPVYRWYEPSARAEARETLTESLTEQGRELFSANCASCHGAEGQGVDAPALNSQQFLLAATDDQIASLIAHGVPGTEMAAYALDFGGFLTLEQIEAVATFIRSWEEDAPDRPDWRSPEGGDGHDEEPADAHEEEPADAHEEEGTTTTTALGTTTTEPEPELDAADLFANNCARCHGADLSGDEGPPLDATSHSTGEPDEHLIEAITFGRDEMPSFADELTEEQILALVAYIREVQAGG